MFGEVKRKVKELATNKGFEDSYFSMLSHVKAINEPRTMAEPALPLIPAGGAIEINVKHCSMFSKSKGMSRDSSDVGSTNTTYKTVEPSSI